VTSPNCRAARSRDAAFVVEPNVKLVFKHRGGYATLEQNEPGARTKFMSCTAKVRGRKGAAGSPPRALRLGHSPPSRGAWRAAAGRVGPCSSPAGPSAPRPHTPCQHGAPAPCRCTACCTACGTRTWRSSSGRRAGTGCRRCRCAALAVGGQEPGCLGLLGLLGGGCREPGCWRPGSRGRLPGAAPSHAATPTAAPAATSPCRCRHTTASCTLRRPLFRSHSPSCTPRCTPRSSTCACCATAPRTTTSSRSTRCGWLAAGGGGAVEGGAAGGPLGGAALGLCSAAALLLAAALRLPRAEGQGAPRALTTPPALRAP
jgi:hypothetical protein